MLSLLSITLYYFHSPVGTSSYPYVPNISIAPKRRITNTATLSCLATVQQVCDFAASTFHLSRQDVRLWQILNQDVSTYSKNKVKHWVLGLLRYFENPTMLLQWAPKKCDIIRNLLIICVRNLFLCNERKRT